MKVEKFPEDFVDCDRKLASIWKARKPDSFGIKVLKLISDLEHQRPRPPGLRSMSPCPASERFNAISNRPCPKALLN
jgi:hypothetical protein